MFSLLQLYKFIYLYLTFCEDVIKMHMNKKNENFFPLVD